MKTHPLGVQLFADGRTDGHIERQTRRN